MNRKHNIVVESNNSATQSKKSKQTSDNELVQENTPDLPGLCKLPNEFILTMMDNLPFYDNMSLSMTCVRFHNLFNSFKPLHKDKLVKISGENYDTFFQLFCSAIRNKGISCPILTHIEFSGCNISNEHQIFWRGYGEYVKSLAFSDCECDDSGDDKILLRIFSNCPNLEEFKMIPASESCTRLVNVSSKLQYIELKKIQLSKISDYAFNNFIVNSPKLKQMEVPFPQIPAQYKRVGCKLMKYKSIPIHEKLDNRELTFENFMGVLPLSNITSFGNTNISNSEMIYICKLKDHGFKLDELCLYDERSRLLQRPNVLHDMNHLTFHTYHDSLKKLNLDLHDSLLNGLNVLKNVETLKISNSISYENLLQIKELKNLKHLELGTKISGARDPPSIFGFEDHIHTILKDLPNLQALHMTRSIVAFFDLDFNRARTGLKELQLKNCAGINMKKMFENLDKNHKSLRKLSLIKCTLMHGVMNDDDICSRILTMDTESSDEEIYDGISGLKHLEYLELTDTDITDKGVIEQFKWNQLKVLKFTENENLTDVALESLSKHCPALIELSLSGCSKITNYGVNHLRCLQRLRKIDLTGTLINVVGIRSLVYSPCPLTEFKFDDHIRLERDLLEALTLKLTHRFPPIEQPRDDDIGMGTCN